MKTGARRQCCHRMIMARPQGDSGVRPSHVVRTVMVVAAAIAVVAAAALAGVTQRGAAIIDQQQTATQASGAMTIGGGSDQKLAQIATAGVAGFLSELRLPVACYGASELVLEIVESEGLGVPTAVVRSSQRFRGPFTGPAAFASLTLSRPVFFPVGRRFGFILSSPGNCAMDLAPAGESYARGRAYFDARPNPPGWVCLCEFTGNPFDLPFQTVVQPACVVPDVRRRTLSAAAAVLRINGCRLGRTGKAASRRVKRGFVIRQSPAPRTELAPRSAVRLVVSSGRPRRSS